MKAYLQKVQIGEHDLVGKLIFTRIRRIALLSDLDCEIANAHAQCQLIRMLVVQLAQVVWAKLFA